MITINKGGVSLRSAALPEEEAGSVPACVEAPHPKLC